MILTNTITAIGLTKENVNRLIGKIKRYTGVKISVTESHFITEIKLSVEGDNEKEAVFNLKNVKERVVAALGQNVFTGDENSIQGRVVELLKKHSLKLATAESCTSGIISSKITDVNGASEVFDFGISAYSNEIKVNALNVNQKLIDTYGAVSSQTAAQMAIGAMRISGADIGLSVTGVAGPQMSEGKPVGLVYVGMCDKYGLWVLKLELFDESLGREEIRERTAILALDFVRRYLEFTNFGAPLFRGNDDFCTKLDKMTLFSVSHEYEVAFEEEIENKETELGGTELQENESVVEEEESSDIGVEVKLDIISEEKPHKETVSSKKPFIRKILPWVGDSVGELIRKLLVIVVCIVTVAFTSYFATDFLSLKTERETASKISAIYNAALGNENANELNENGMLNKFQNLYNENNDVFGWINASDSKIYAPVMKSDPNYFYASKDFYKNNSKFGSLFLDANVKTGKGDKNKNIVIYGNNIHNEAAFSPLVNFTKIAYLKSNHTFSFDTLYECKNYVIFAVLKENSSIGLTRNNFKNDDDFEMYVKTLRNLSLFDTNVTVDKTDNLLTLITEDESGGDGRVIIIAKEIKENDSINYNATVNTKK